MKTNYYELADFLSEMILVKYTLTGEVDNTEIEQLERYIELFENDKIIK